MSLFTKERRNFANRKVYTFVVYALIRNKSKSQIKTLLNHHRNRWCSCCTKTRGEDKGLQVFKENQGD